ncbi:histidine kinase [Anaeromyxobacter dehalogenans 2CP-1]|uniref:histidine kinase n=1 Tax=Anaeromyxobacter dehalogenans (strain ATCC BAA-258 / DSM 21875 / 2CP-1) TaxID=455488 RepID=B8J6G3_ANAD2|nr:transporter substrate-binding domain-containing protein [Anaeromyxobacter dehalogenans]ACL65144.1 histidine kinase [Anaeromyxobacter dehalogenans 2CP-1]
MVGGDRDYPPYEFLDRDGKPAGFNVELTRAIAEVTGMRVEIRLGAWSEMRAALAAGRIDALQGMSWSEQRAAEVDFSPPHLVVNHAIFARKGTPAVASLEALRGHAVAVHRDGIMDDQLTTLGMGDRLLRTDTPADALRLLASGKGEYAVVAALPGTFIIRELKLTNLDPVAHSVASQRYGYAVRKGDAALRSRFDEGLAILKQTGRYEALRQRWLGVLEPQPVSWGKFFQYGAVVFVPLLLVLGGTVLWSRQLQREVAERTASLAAAVEELRLNQAQLVQADKMAALGVLVSGVAHEINNPNGFILLNMPALKDVYLDALEALDRDRPDGAPPRLGGLPFATAREEVPRMLDEMLDGARRIRRIVEDLKDFARREDAPARAPLDLDEVVRAAVRLVENPIRKATTRFELALDGALPPVVGSAQRIEQVIVNLVLNACQALPSPDRAVRVSTRADGARGVVICEVRDEGVGIPPEHLPRLTDPFFTTKRDSGGTGLGLSVSSGIVKEHGGTLEFRSAPGAGTTATVTLPAAPDAGPQGIP